MEATVECSFLARAAGDFNVMVINITVKLTSDDPGYTHIHKAIIFPLKILAFIMCCIRV